MNEKGFLYPFTLCVLLIFSTFLMIQSNLYLDEKRLLNEIEQIEKNKYYFLSSTKKMESVLAGEIIEPNGQFIFDAGSVSYSIEDTVEHLKVTFTLATESGGHLTSVGYYDKESKKMIKWIEKG